MFLSAPSLRPSLRGHRAINHTRSNLCSAPSAGTNPDPAARLQLLALRISCSYLRLFCVRHCEGTEQLTIPEAICALRPLREPIPILRRVFSFLHYEFHVLICAFSASVIARAPSN